jgi:hypothetical protein
MHDEAGRANGNDVASIGDNPVAEQISLVTVPIADHHLVANFCCAKSQRVEQFLRQDCRPLLRINYARVFVLPDLENPSKILGYYSLSAAHVERDLLNNKHRGSLPAFPAPMALLGFMGRDDSAPKGKLGPVLIQDAARRVHRSNDVGMWGLMLNAENEELVPWYEKAGFKRVPPEKTSPHVPRLMYAPLKAFLPELNYAPSTLKD